MQEFFDKIKKLDPYTQVSLLRDMAWAVCEGCEPWKDKKEWTREDSKKCGVTQAYKAERQKTDLRFQVEKVRTAVTFLEQLCMELESMAGPQFIPPT